MKFKTEDISQRQKEKKQTLSRKKERSQRKIIRDSQFDNGNDKTRNQQEERLIKKINEASGRQNRIERSAGKEPKLDNKTPEPDQKRLSGASDKVIEATEYKQAEDVLAANLVEEVKKEGSVGYSDIKKDAKYKQLEEEAIRTWEGLHGSRYDKEDGILSAAFQDYYFKKLEDDVKREFKSQYPDDFRKYRLREKSNKQESEKQNVKKEQARRNNAGDFTEEDWKNREREIKEKAAAAVQKKNNETWTPKPPEEFEPIDAESRDIEGSKGVVKYENKETKLEKIQSELDKARKEYLEMDYKKRGMWDRINRFFGKRMVREEGYANKLEQVSYKTGANGEKIVDDQDVVYMRALYENKLMDYKNALLDDAKNGGVSNEKLGEILKTISLETSVKLADEHENVRVEQGKISIVLGKHLKGMSEWYNKQPRKVKLGLAVAFGLGGTTAAFMGAAGAATAIGVAAFFRRAFVGTVTGTGASMWLEQKTGAKRETRIEKETEEFVKEAGFFKYDEKTFNLKLNEKIFNADKNISSIKNKSVRNVVLGGTAGILVGGAAAYIGKEFGVGEYIGKGISKAGGFMKEFLGNYGEGLAPSPYGMGTENAIPGQIAGTAAGRVEVPDGKNIPVPPVQENPTGPKNIIPEKPAVIPPGKPPLAVPVEPQLKPSAPGTTWDNPLKVAPEDAKPLKITPEGKAPISSQEAPSGKAPITPEAPEGKKLMVEKSGRGKLGGSFEGIIKKSFIEDGLDRDTAGKNAHLMRLEFEKYVNELKAEGKIPKNFSLNKIQPGAQIELSADGKHVVGFTDGEGGKFTKQLYIEDENAAPSIQEVPENTTKIPEESGGKAPEKEILERNEGNIKAADDYQSEEFNANESSGPKNVKPENWLPIGKEPAEILGRLNNQFVSEVKKMSLGNIDNWDHIKDRKATDVIAWLKKDSQLEHTKLAKGIREVMADYIKELKGEGIPKKGETVSKWLARVIKEKERMMLESKKYSIAA